MYMCMYMYMYKSDDYMYMINCACALFNLASIHDIVHIHCTCTGYSTIISIEIDTCTLVVCIDLHVQ